MWRDRILAAALLRNNEVPDEHVRELLADGRPLAIAARALITGNFIVMSLGVLLSGTFGGGWYLSAVLVGIHETQLWFAWRAPDVRALQRRRLAGAIAFSLWAWAAVEVHGGWAGLSPFVVILAAFSLVLDGRGLA